MRLFSWLSGLFEFDAAPRSTRGYRQIKLNVEALEEREVPSTVNVAGGVLTVTGTPQDDRIAISLDPTLTQIVVQDNGRVIGRFASASISSIAVHTGDGNDRIQVASAVRQPALLDGGNGKNTIIAGGGPTTIVGGTGNSTLGGGTGPTTFVGGSGNQLIVGGTSTNTGTTGTGTNHVQNVTASNTIVTNPKDIVLVNQPNPITISSQSTTTITAAEVQQLLLRATAATSRNDAIIVVVDRNGRILGVRVENGVSPAITGSPAALTFAVDGAVSLARTGAYFSSDAAPLTSRTVSFISQTTITQREVDSNPNITDPNSTLRGPGFVAPVRIGANFPPGVPNTPEVDLFAIEHTNRDSVINPGVDGIKGTADDVMLPYRFNINPAFVPAGKTIFAPESYGFVSGSMPKAQSRGIATLPGGVPLYKHGTLVGGIGVFFPGTTGYASAENSSLSATYNPKLPDRSLEAEYIGLAAAGGSSGLGLSVGALNGIPALPGFDIPAGRIDLVGITLDSFGPGGTQGAYALVAFGKSLGVGSPTAGQFLGVDLAHDQFLAGLPVADGWLVAPHNGVGITAAQVTSIINAGITQAWQTRSALRVPLNSSTRMVFAVVDLTGAVVGLYRMPDAPVFSIGVAVAKARNDVYYDDPTQLQPIDALPGIAPGVSLTSRTFRFLALPRYPSGAQGAPAGVFSILNDGGTNPNNGLQVGAPLAASAFQSVLGYDVFNPNTNFHDKNNILNQNGVVFFPGSTALYRHLAGGAVKLVGGFGVSGDGVDQDDVVTSLGQVGFEPINNVARADAFFFRGVRLPYQKYNRNPTGGVGS